jgi:hypothetical protein
MRTDVFGRRSGLLRAPPEFVGAWRSHVDELTESQERAGQAGALDRTPNLLVVAPTTSRKTFVAEMAAASSALTKRRHAIFIVSFRALADEHSELFRERCGHVLSVVISSSGVRQPWFQSIKLAGGHLAIARRRSVEPAETIVVLPAGARGEARQARRGAFCVR